MNVTRNRIITGRTSIYLMDLKTPTILFGTASMSHIAPKLKLLPVWRPPYWIWRQPYWKWMLPVTQISFTRPALVSSLCMDPCNLTFHLEQRQYRYRGRSQNYWSTGSHVENEHYPKQPFTMTAIHLNRWTLQAPIAFGMSSILHPTRGAPDTTFRHQRYDFCSGNWGLNCTSHGHKTVIRKHNFVKIRNTSLVCNFQIRFRKYFGKRKSLFRNTFFSSPRQFKCFWSPQTWTGVTSFFSYVMYRRYGQRLDKNWWIPQINWVVCVIYSLEIDLLVHLCVLISGIGFIH
jgi:hypothetical protein